MKCEHGLTTKECYVCMSPKYGKHDTKQERVAKPQWEEHMSIEAMKQWLEALEGADSIICVRGITPDDICEAIVSMRQTIERAEKQKPVNIKKVAEEHGINLPTEFVPGTKFYTQPQQAEKQEPVALQMDVIVVNLVREGINKHRARELAEHFIKHTTPQPQREWVGLTDEEAEKCRRGTWQATYQAIDALLREKNGGKA